MIRKAILLLVGFFVVKHVMSLVILMGYHKTIYKHWPGPCRTVSPVKHGSEDIALTKTGLAIVTSGIDVAYRGDSADPRMKAVEGKLYLFDFNNLNPEKNAVEIQFEEKFEFVPHGISIWEGQDGNTHFFVVNHRQEAETVEIFKLTGTATKPTASHVQSVQDPLLRSVNDVLATGPNSFYASNDGYLRFTALRLFERFLFRSWGSVVYYDGKAARIVVPSTFEFNGMGMSRDGNFVYIASPMTSSISIYERNRKNNDLTFHQELAIGTFPDNIFVHPETGDLWTGSTPAAHLLIAAFENLDRFAPSQVVRIRPMGSKERPFEKFQLYEVYSDPGDLMSTSSSVAVVGNKLLIGSVIQNLVYCEMKSETVLSRDDY